MKVLILNYHETVPDATGRGHHVLPDASFDKQMAMVACSGIPVLPPAAAISRAEPAADHDHGLAISFDDGSLSDLVNARKLASRGWRGIFFLSTSRIGQPGYMDWPQIRELLSLGMTIGSHSHEHVPMTTLSQAEALRQLRLSRQTLSETLGVDVQCLAFPGGVHNPMLERLAIEAGYKAQFGTRWGLHAPGPEGPARVIRRNNIVNTMGTRQFEQLIHLRNQGRRELSYLALTVLKRIIGEGGYRRARGFVGRQVRSWSCRRAR
jgi:peptidoglycan/xylan/chitin deacetylase (PgdA/CDA1 family)